MRAAAAALVVLASCGRLGFSAAGDGGAGSDSDAAIDADLRPRHEVTEQFVPANGSGLYYGISVAASGDGTRMVVGAYGFNAGRGEVNVWRYDGAALGWTSEGVLLADNGEPNDFFGLAVAIDAAGTRLVVGADHEDGVGNAVPDSGAAYVFERTGTTWLQTAYVKAAAQGVGDHFGVSVAISADGSMIAVGASGEDSASPGLDGDPTDKSKVDAGAAYFFKPAGTAWSQTHYVKPPVTAPDQYFGASVSLSTDGSILAVGAPHDTSQTGAAFIVDPSATTETLRAENGDVGDNFGLSVALSGNGKRLIVGAPGEDGPGRGINASYGEGGGESGAAYIFDRTAGWAQSAYIKTANSDPNDSVGVSVAMSSDGTHAIVGASGEAGSGTGRDAPIDNMAGNAGAVYQLLRGASGEWTQQSYIKASDTQGGDQFGTACAMSQDGFGIAVGAPQRNGMAGALYVYLSVPD